MITAIKREREQQKNNGQYSHKAALQRELKNKTAKVGVIGLGYVGLPTACHYASKGYTVTGFDVSETKVESLNSGINYINDVDDDGLRELVNQKQFTATTDMKLLGDMNVLLICVPTPVNNLKEPDISYVRDVGRIVAEHVKEGTLVILESTTYPGTTEEYICTPLTERGYGIGKDLFVVYSPERIDPGNKRFNLSNTPKVVGGMTETCTGLACKFIGPTAHRVKGIRVAELSKIFENTFRWINMALVNEMTVLCNDLEIDI